MVFRVDRTNDIKLRISSITEMRTKYRQRLQLNKIHAKNQIYSEKETPLENSFHTA